MCVLHKKSFVTEQSSRREGEPSATYEILRLHCNTSFHDVNKDPTIRPYPESDEHSAQPLLFEMHFIILFVPVRIILAQEQ